MKWFDVLPEKDLQPGDHTVMVAEGIPIAVFNLNGQFFAIEDCCTHQGLPLSDGYVEEDTITCPFHGAKFCIKSGEVVAPPAFENLPTYETRVQEGMIQVKV